MSGKGTKTRSVNKNVLIFVLLFAVLGGSLVLFSQAASPYTSSEAELGTTNGASIVTDSSASGGKYVQFGAYVSLARFEPPTGTVYLGVSTDHNVSTGGSDRLSVFDQAAGISQPSIFNEYSTPDGSFSTVI